MTKSGGVIMDCEYFPCIPWFQEFIKAPEVSIEQHEFFVRSSYRNRAYVAGPNGVVCLTVPLEGGRNQRTAMKDVKISYEEDWQALHWKTLVSFYNRSAYFEFFEHELAVYYKTKFEYLLDANLASLKLILKLLQLKKVIKLSQAYEKEVSLDLRYTILPKNRKATSEYQSYIQPFSDRNGFEPNLSMLDYLFCCGKWI